MCDLCYLGYEESGDSEYRYLFGMGLPLDNIDDVYPDGYNCKEDYHWTIEQSINRKTNEYVNHLYCMDLSDAPMYELRIKYCPICGRELTLEKEN